MKVTAIINDELITNVIELSHGKNITEGVVIALEDYVYSKRIEQLIEGFDARPVEFKDGYSAGSIRELNRNPRI